MKPVIDSINGEYINLRRLSLSDAAMTYGWRAGMRANLLNGGAPTVEAQERWIASRPTSEINFMIELKNNQPVGMISLIEIDQKNKRAESARFLIGEEEIVKGLPVAVEAMKLLYELAFLHFELHKVYGTVASQNNLMIKWQKYLGMTEEGRLRNHYWINEEYQDAVCLGILSEEFKTKALPKMKTLISMARTQLNK